MVKKLQEKTDQVRIQLVSLSHLQRWPRNPKGHDLPLIKASLVKYGFVAPIVLDERSGRMVAGHGRLEALLELKKESASPPRRIEVRGDEWFVPVLRGVEFASERAAEEYLLVDNRATELGRWVEPTLAPIFTEFHQAGEVPLGWTADEVTHLVAKFIPTEDMSEFSRESYDTPKDGKPKPDGSWFYTEYYGDEARFNALREKMRPWMRTDHEILHDVFEQMVDLWVREYPEVPPSPVVKESKGMKGGKRCKK